MSWCDLDLTFDHDILTLSFGILVRNKNISETVRCRKLILGRRLIKGYSCAMLWCDLDLTFHLAILNLTFKILCGLYLGSCKV